MSPVNIGVGWGLIALTIVLQFLLLNRRVRQQWLEVELLALVILGFAIWQLTTNSSANSTTPYMYSSTETANASFMLPADKIQSDLTVLQPNSTVTLLLVGDHAVQNYQDVTLLDIKGVGSQDHKPPYNKDAVEVNVSLPQGVKGITAATFASQLQSVKSIYIFPSVPVTPTPRPTLSNLSFALPVSKIGSDLNCLQSSQPGDSVTVILVVNNQLLYYSAKVTSLPPQMSTSTTSTSPSTSTPKNACPTPTKSSTTSASTKGSTTSMTTPTPTSQETIGIQLTNASNDTVIDFANQLPNATTIYLLQ